MSEAKSWAGLQFLQRSDVPRSDECIMSWIARLCAFVPVSMEQLFEEVAGAKYTDLDHRFSPEIAMRIAAAAWVPVDRVRALRSAFERRSPEYLNPVMRAVPAAAFSVCPSCLREDEIPYFRQSWRVRLVKVCEKHRVVLMERCPTCDGVILLKASRVTKQRGAHSLRYCQACGDDFGRTTPIMTTPSSYESLHHMQKDWEEKIQCSHRRYWLSNLPLRDVKDLNASRSLDLHFKYRDRDLFASPEALRRAGQRAVVTLREAHGSGSVRYRT